jgi:hypothetical protein
MPVEILSGVTGLLLVVGVYFCFVRRAPHQQEQA